MQCNDTALLFLVMGLFAPWSKLQGSFAYPKESMPRKCRLPPRPGRCKLALENFYYDFKSSMCKTFIYNGCGGNRNNFANLFDCIYECERFDLLVSWSSMKIDKKWRQEPPQKCKYRKRVGWCRQKLKRYYYDARIKRCMPFIYSGCRGNENNFVSYWECSRVCEPLGKPQDTRNPEVDPELMLPTCQQPLDKGPCTEIFPRFYYDSKTKKCKPFDFGGCNGNRNNFMTEAECRRECGSFEPEMSRTIEKQELPLKCKLPVHEGVCKSSFWSYYYNAEKKRCFVFLYGGCGGNDNRFCSFKECYEECEKYESPAGADVSEDFLLDYCDQPLDLGSCNEQIPRYYYDFESRTCKPFNYGGCGGNRNNFETELDCLWSCAADASRCSSG